MRSDVGRKLEMVARVRSFSRAHPSEEAGYQNILGQLEERLARAEAIAGMQVEETAAAISARARRDDIRKVVHFHLLRYLVEVGGVVAKDRVELASRFKLPQVNASNRLFLASVRSMVAVAGSQKDSLVEAGMVPTLLDELSTQLDEFEAFSASARLSKLGHMGARRELDKVSGELSKLVRLLDGINRRRFEKEPDVLDTWNAAQRMVQRRKPAQDGEGETPAGPGGVAPAA